MAELLHDLRGLTLRQPWNWAILYAGKPVENRPCRAPKSQAGKWFALHAGAVYDEKGAVRRRRIAAAFFAEGRAA